MATTNGNNSSGTITMGVKSFAYSAQGASGSPIVTKNVIDDLVLKVNSIEESKLSIEKCLHDVSSFDRNKVYALKIRVETALDAERMKDVATSLRYEFAAHNVAVVPIFISSNSNVSFEPFDDLTSLNNQLTALAKEEEIDSLKKEIVELKSLTRFLYDRVSELDNDLRKRHEKDINF